MTYTTKYIQMSDTELLAIYEQRRDNGEGDGIGTDAHGTVSKQSVADATAFEGWESIRDISDRPDVDTLLARDGQALYIVSDVNGPWAIQITYADGSDRP